MLKAKLVALCVCPAVLAPPAIVAVHRPTRHAVAHLLQRAAHRLDHGVPAALSLAAAPDAKVSCIPTLADAAGSGDVPTIGGVGLVSLVPADGAILGDASRGGNGPGSGGGFFPGGGGGGGASGGGFGGGGGVSTNMPGITTSAVLTPVSIGSTVSGNVGGLPPSVGSTMGSVPEPGTWALLVTGFGVVGVGLRYKRIAVA